MNDLALAKRYISLSHSAASRGIEFELSLTAFRNLMKAKKCYYLGIPLNSKHKDPNQLTVDRVNSSKGYVDGNCVACSHLANQFKSLWEQGTVSIDQAEKIIRKTKKFKKNP